MRLTKSDFEAYHELVTWYFWDADDDVDSVRLKKINHLTAKIRKERERLGIEIDDE